MKQWGIFFSKAKPWKKFAAVAGTLVAIAVVVLATLTII